MSTVIKAGTYCPVCRGMPLADCRHRADEFSIRVVPATIPVCAVTGLIAGDSDACGDCDPCISGAGRVPDVVKRLLKDRDGWREKYSEAVVDGESTTRDCPTCGWIQYKVYGCECDRCGTMIAEPSEAPLKPSF
jgi:hypothetical protein